MLTTRCRFLQAATLGPVGARALPAQAQKIFANDRIRMAAIGVGGRAFDDMHSSLAVPGVELVAVRDVYDGCEALLRSDVDAVLVATPDHWHSRIACRRAATATTWTTSAISSPPCEPAGPWWKTRCPACAPAAPRCSRASGVSSSTSASGNGEGLRI